MFKTKNLSLMDVFDLYGNKIGVVSDVILNLNERKVLGVTVSCYKVIEKKINVLKENIISLNEKMITEKTVQGKFLSFTDVKNMDVIGRDGGIYGVTEDILFNEYSFEIKAIIISSGFIKNFFTGKKIVPIKEIIAGDESLLKLSNNEFNMLSIPHQLFMEVENYEKNI